MARQVSVLAVKGSVGNLRNYKTRGVSYITVATKGGPSAEQIKTLETLSNCLKQNEEWAGSCMFVHALYSPLRLVGTFMFDRLLTSRLIQYSRKLMAQDNTNPYGRRTLSLSEDRPNFVKVVLNKAKRIAKVCNVIISVNHTLFRNSVTFTLPSGVNSEMFNFSGKETHVRIGQLIGYCADYYKPSLDESYQPLDLANPFGSIIAWSDWFQRSDTEPHVISVTTDLDIASSLSEQDTVYQVILIQFSRLFNGEYLLTSNSACGFIDAF